MKLLATILLVALVGAGSTKAGSIQPVLAQANFDSSLANYLLQPSAAVAMDPAVSAQCFNYYLPILTEVANTFSIQYQACLTIANEQTTNLTNQAAQNRATYAQEAGSICTAYQGCDNLTDTLSFFDCYATVSNQEVTQVYDISNQAVSAGNAFSQGLAQIQQNEASCTNATETTYVQNTAQTYQLLDTCLLNGLPASASPSTLYTTVLPIDSTTAAFVDNGNDDSNAANDAFVLPAMAKSGDGSQVPKVAPAKAALLQFRRGAHITRN